MRLKLRFFVLEIVFLSLSFSSLSSLGYSQNNLEQRLQRDAQNDLDMLKGMSKPEIREFLGRYISAISEAHAEFNSLIEQDSLSKRQFDGFVDSINDEIDSLSQLSEITSLEIDGMKSTVAESKQVIEMIKPIEQTIKRQVSDLEKQLVRVKRIAAIKEGDESGLVPNSWADIVEAGVFPRNASLELVLSAIHAAPSCASSLSLAFPAIYELSEIPVPEILVNVKWRPEDFKCNECDELEMAPYFDAKFSNYTDRLDFLTIDVQTTGNNLLTFNEDFNGGKEFLFGGIVGANDGSYRALKLIDNKEESNSMGLHWINGNLYLALDRDQLDLIGSKYDYGGITAGRLSCLEDSWKQNSWAGEYTNSKLSELNFNGACYFYEEDETTCHKFLENWKTQNPSKSATLPKPRVVFPIQAVDAPGVFLEPLTLFYKLRVVTENQ